MKQNALPAIFGLALIACATSTAPKSDPERRALETNAEATVKSMTARDPELRDLLDRSAGYAVFPEVGKGGFIVGGAHGRGIVFEAGRKIGFVEMKQASVGAQVGGQTFSELIVFQTQAALERLQSGTFNVAGQASAVLLQTGAAAKTRFGRDGTAIFVVPRGGAMIDVSVAGQRLNFEPKG